jgi:MSHA pilin protein MshC
VRGFTLVELVVVMVLLGILAMVAVPRLSGIGIASFNSMGFADRLIESVRYAQKQAIAKRRNVCITFSSGSASFTFASIGGATQPCNTNLTGPGGQNPYTVVPETISAVTISAFPSNFGFDAQGRSIDTTTGATLSAVQLITITGTDGSRTFSIEPDTGYAHT